MNTIELQTTIPVQTFDAPATVAIGRNAPEWLAVVRLAKDLGGAIRANQITAELLGGLPAVVGKRVIDRSVALGLLEQSDQERKEGVALLSKLGEEALNRGQVFISEDRLWRFYFAEHPLLDQSLLHIEPLDGGSAQSERNELREAKRPGHGRPDDGENTPDCLLTVPKKGQVLSSVADSGPSFVLKEVSEAGVRIGGESLRLQLVSVGCPAGTANRGCG